MRSKEKLKTIAQEIPQTKKSGKEGKFYILYTNEKMDQRRVLVAGPLTWNAAYDMAATIYRGKCVISPDPW